MGYRTGQRAVMKMAEAKRVRTAWFPVIDYRKCTGCLACLMKCTHGVYAKKDGKPEVVKPGNCVLGCRGCEPVCPKGAITHVSKGYIGKISKGCVKGGCGCG